MIDPPVSTLPVADFDRVMFDALVTDVDALPQLVVAHEPPGVAGLEPPVGSTDA